MRTRKGSGCVVLGLSLDVHVWDTQSGGGSIKVNAGTLTYPAQRATCSSFWPTDSGISLQLRYRNVLCILLVVLTGSCSRGKVGGLEVFIGLLPLHLHKRGEIGHWYWKKVRPFFVEVLKSILNSLSDSGQHLHSISNDCILSLLTLTLCLQYKVQNVLLLAQTLNDNISAHTQSPITCNTYLQL